MDRRPHWTDDLIDAVRYAAHDWGPESHLDVYAVIAAVEDWHKAKRDSRIRTHSEGCWRWHNECAEALIEYQQAAIKRVRELRDRFRDHEKWVSYRNVETLLTHALEGDA